MTELRCDIIFLGEPYTFIKEPAVTDLMSGRQSRGFDHTYVNHTLVNTLILV